MGSTCSSYCGPCTNEIRTLDDDRGGAPHVDIDKLDTTNNNVEADDDIVYLRYAYNAKLPLNHEFTDLAVQIIKK